MDSDPTGGGEDLIVRINVEPLCNVFETNIRLCISDTIISKKKNKETNNELEEEMCAM